MPHDGKPYHFDAVWPVAETIDLGKRLAAGAHGWTELEDASGISGCCAASMGGNGPFGATGAKAPNYGNVSLKKLGERMAAKAEGEAAAFGAPGDERDAEAIPPWLYPIIAAALQKLLARLLGGK